MNRDPATPPRVPYQRSWFGRAVHVLAILTIFVCIVAVVVLQVLAASIDFAIVNTLTIGLTFLAFVAVLAIGLLWPRYSLRFRLITLAIVVLGITLAGVLFEVDGVNGRLLPRFRFRWSAKPDQLLEVPVATGEATIDLSQPSSPRDFPQFLGPNRSGHVRTILLKRSWEDELPALIWRRPIGAGCSAFSAVNGFAVTMEQRGAQELITCYEISSGDLMWVHGIKGRHETTLGGIGPRATPTIHEGRVYALGATGMLRCLEGKTGELAWSVDIPKLAGVAPGEDHRAIAWGRAASPLIVDDLVIVPLGGPVDGPWVSLAAFDKSDGTLKWKNGASQVSYSSPSLAVLCDQSQILIVNEASVSGHRPEDGEMLWSHPWPGTSNAESNASQAVVLPGNRVFLSKDYQIGSEVVQLELSEDGQCQLQTVWSERQLLKTKFTNVVVIDSAAYGLSDGILECVDLEKGTRLWKDRRRGDFGHGQILAVGDVILVQAESGEVVMVDADPNRFRILGRFAALNDQTWNNLCLFGSFLLVRNSVEAACYELPVEK